MTQPETETGWKLDDEKALDEAKSGWAVYDAMKEAPGYAADFARTAGSSATLGQLPRARAAVEALTTDKTYGDALIEQTAKDYAAENRLHPFARGTAQALGGIGPGMGIGYAGGKLLGTAARPLWQRSVIGIGEGAIQGGAEAAGRTRGSDPNEYYQNATMGSLYGGAVGGGVPVVAAGAVKAVRGAADRGWFGGPTKTLTDAANADRAGLDWVNNTPGAMLPDAGPSMLGTAQGLMPGTVGPGKTALTNELKGRVESSPARVNADVDQAIGPATTPEFTAEAVRERMSPGMTPEYDRVLKGAKAVDNTALANRLEGMASIERGEAAPVIARVRQMLNVPGTDVLDPHPVAMQKTRTAVRGMMEDANKYDKETRGILKGIYRDLTDEMHQKIPGIREVDSAYAELGAQEKALEPTGVFDKGKTNVIRPPVLERTFNEASEPKGANVGPSAEGFRMREAARAEIDRIVGTSRNDMAALKNALGTPEDYNQQKLATLFGKEKAERIHDIIERERIFFDSHKKIVEDSQTANRLASAKAQEPGTSKIPWDATLYGSVMRGAQAGAQGAVNFVRGRSSEATRDSIAAMMATRDPGEIARLSRWMLEAGPRRDARETAAAELLRRGLTGFGTGLGATMPIVPQQLEDLPPAALKLTVTPRGRD